MKKLTKISMIFLLAMSCGGMVVAKSSFNYQDGKKHERDVNSGIRGLIRDEMKEVKEEDAVRDNVERAGCFSLGVILAYLLVCL